MDYSNKLTFHICWQTFLDATARVEGNGPTGCIVLAEYKRVILELEALQAESLEYSSLDKSITKMIKWLTKYMDEAVEFHAIVLATILNPWFRGKFFTIRYPNQDFSANQAIEDAFNTVLEELEQQELPPTYTEDGGPTEQNHFDIFGVSNAGSKKTSTSELEDYVQGKYAIKQDQTPLGWWKVSLILFFLLIMIYMRLF